MVKGAGLQMSSNNYKKKKVRTRSDNILNVIIAVVILAFLVLAGFAVAPSIQKMIANYEASKPQEVETVEKFAESQGKTADEFLAEYGLTDNENVNKDTAIDGIQFYMTLENMAKYQNTSVEELKAHYGLDDTTANDTTYSDAMANMNAGPVVEDMYGTDFETFRTQMGLPDVLTETSKWSEVTAAAQAMQEAANLAASEEPAAEEGADSTATEAPADAADAVDASDAPEASQAPGEGE